MEVLNDLDSLCLLQTPRQFQLRSTYGPEYYSSLMDLNTSIEMPIMTSFAISMTFLSVQCEQFKEKLNNFEARFTQFVILTCILTYFSVDIERLQKILHLTIENSCICIYILRYHKKNKKIRRNLPFFCLLVFRHCAGCQIASSPSKFYRCGLDTVVQLIGKMRQCNLTKSTFQTFRRKIKII